MGCVGIVLEVPVESCWWHRCKVVLRNSEVLAEDEADCRDQPVPDVDKCILPTHEIIIWNFGRECICRS